MSAHPPPRQHREEGQRNSPRLSPRRQGPQARLREPVRLVANSSTSLLPREGDHQHDHRDENGGHRGPGTGYPETHKRVGVQGPLNQGSGAQRHRRSRRRLP